MERVKIPFVMKKLLSVIFLCLVFWAACEKKVVSNDDDSIVDPPDTTAVTDTIPHTMPQGEIPWPSLADSPWPMAKHDPQLTGRSPYLGPVNGTVKWTYRDSLVQFQSGIALGKAGQIHVIGGDAWAPGGVGKIITLEKETGTLNWEYEIGEGIPTLTPLVMANGNTVYGTRHGKIFCFDGTGTQIWTYEIDVGSGETVLNNFNIDKNGRIYFTTSSPPRLLCLSPEGDEVYVKDLQGEYSSGGLAFSPDGETMYLYDDVPGLSAFTSDGVRLWTYPIIRGYIWSSPLVDNQGNIYFTIKREYDISGSDTLKPSVVSLNPDGTLRWEYADIGWGYTHHDISMDKNGYIWVGNSRTLYSVYYNGELRLKKDFEDDLVPFALDGAMVTDNEGNIYFGSSWEGKFFKLNNESDLIWVIDFPIFNDALIHDNSPALDNEGNLYVNTVKWSSIVFCIN